MAALQSIRVQWLECSLDVSAEWLSKVRASLVLKWNTPLEECQLFAGDHQQAQSDVHSVSLAGFLKLLVATSPSESMDRRLQLALQKSGWPRPIRAV